MKQITTMLSAVLVLLLTSCNNQPKTDGEQTTVDSLTESTPAFTPYKAMMVQSTVKDFDKWYTAFNSHDSVRNANGLLEAAVGRGLDNDKFVVVLAEAADIQKAKDFSVSPGLKQRMNEAGVNSVPVISFFDVLRDDTTTIPQQERMMVTHRVKDFDAWLKVYDAEGLASRAANGLVDRYLARGLDDPNTVTLLFAITDMEKAKARVASPELKKIMTDAGVDGPPQITYFKWIAN